MNRRRNIDPTREPFLMLLKLAAEKRAGFAVRTSRDFVNLSLAISESGVGNLSVSTLKRLWGYVPDSGGKNLTTLDILARYAADSIDFEGFCRDCERHSESESGFSRERTLDVEVLSEGDLIRIAWHPDRVVILRYRGGYEFVVESSVRSRLRVGLRVKCTVICAHRPLRLTVLGVESGLPVATYECGRINGVEWSRI